MRKKIKNGDYFQLDQNKIRERKDQLDPRNGQFSTKVKPKKVIIAGKEGKNLTKA